MSEELVKKDEVVEIQGIKITREQIEIIKRNIFIGATDDELRLFFYECKRRGTHPMDRLIFPVVRKDKDGNRRVTFQTGIDYLRAAAEETARYVGQKSVEYGPPIIQSVEGGEIKAPEWAEVSVLRKDPETGEINQIPFRAFWKEFYPGERLGHMWRKMPNLMLAKCAEAGALRKGFPRKLGGLYINEEMEQAEAVPFASHPELKEPQKTNESQPSQSEEPKRTTITVKDVALKEGKGPKGPWTLFKIQTNDDQVFQTFSKTLGDLAIQERGTNAPLRVEYKIVDYEGKQGKVQSKEILSLEMAEREPGENG